MKSLIKTFVRLLLGLVIMAFACVLAFNAGLGLSPWDVLHHGLSQVLPIKMGQASIAVGFVVLIFDILLKEKLGFGTFINIVLVGMTYDIIRELGFVPSFETAQGMEHIFPRVLMCVAAMLIMAFSMYLYMGAELGSGPRDSLMCALTKKTRLPVGGIRLMLEGLAFVAGYFLGGKIGVGSVVLVIGSGPIMQLVFKAFKFDVTQLNNRTISDTISDFKKAGARHGA